MDDEGKGMRFAAPCVREEIRSNEAAKACHMMSDMQCGTYEACREARDD